jgi:hypothetical protein
MFYRGLYLEASQTLLFLNYKYLAFYAEQP